MNNPPKNGAIFIQAISGTVYLMHPQEQHKGIHQKVLAKIKELSISEQDANAGFIWPSGEIAQTSGQVNTKNMKIRNLNDHPIFGPVFAERVKLHYDLGNVKWV